MEWIPADPDINLIEIMRSIIKRNVHENKKNNILRSLGSNKNCDRAEKLTKSMNRRLINVIECQYEINDLLSYIIHCINQKYISLVYFFWLYS